MMQERTKHGALLILAATGLIVSALAGLAEHVSWLEAVCTGFSDGCREATRFTVLRLPIWAWGIAFYLTLLLMLYRARESLTWLMGAAIGVEAALGWIIVSMKVWCIFCAANGLIVVLLAAFSFRKDRFWQTLSMSLSLFLASMLLIPHENELFAFSPSKESSPVIVAKIGEESVTEEKLEGPLSGSIHDLEMNIYQLKKQRLDQMISERVLRWEAEQRGITVDQLLNETALAGGTQVDESEVDRYKEENRARLADWKGSELELRERIRTYLQQQKSYKKVMDYSASLGAKYGVSVYLKEPEIARKKINTEGNPSIGPSDAPVLVVEFSDYQCPACRQVHENVLKIRELYGAKLRWVFKDYPLKMHKDAGVAAEAARCASEQNKFWEYQNVLYGSTEELTLERLREYAGRLGLNGDQFKGCLESRKYQSKIETDVEEAKQIGVDRTPTFLINGKLSFGGLTLERFKELIDAELARAGK
jgi:protein-disulfide isomerase